MAVYKTTDLLSLVSLIVNDGYEYVEVTELYSDDDESASLCIEGIESNYSSIDYEPIESCDFPDDYDCTVAPLSIQRDEFKNLQVRLLDILQKLDAK